MNADRTRVALAAAGAVAPPLADLTWGGWQRVFGYLAPDAFYYFVVGRHLADGNGASFDGERVTNGFHPLWQGVVAALYAATDALGLPEPVFLVAVVVVGLALLGAAAVGLGAAFRLACGRVPPAFPLLPLGLYPLCAGSFGPRFGSWWSFANGMETALALAAFAWALHAMVRRERGAPGDAALALGLALAALTLARLDHGAFALCALAAIAWRVPKTGAAGVREGLVVAAPFALALGAYLAWSVAATGAPLPVSGELKSSFPHPSPTNWRHLEAILADPAARHPGELWRMAQMLLPAIPAALLLPWLATLRGRGRADALTRPLAVGAVFVLVLAAYGFAFVGLWHQGHWYFPVSITWMTLAALYLWEKERPLAEGRTARVVAAASAVAALLWFAFAFRAPNAGEHYRALYAARGEIVAHFGEAQPKLVEYDDGIVAFATGFPALSGLGFAIDREAVDWARRGRLLWLAWERGHDHLASLNYFGRGGLDETSSSDAIRAALDATFFLSPPETAPFEFRVVHAPRDASIVFIRFAPRR